MKDIRYLSPTSIKTYEESEEEFYKKYLSDKPYDRDPQTRAMSVGSAFDAFVKSYLYGELGDGSLGNEFDRTRIFEAQVESHNREWAWAAGEKCFEAYRRLGGLGDLMLMAGGGTGLRMEFDMTGSVEGRDRNIGVTLRGKPDMYFRVGGVGVLLDWKVNGFCSKKAPSPRKGYVSYRTDSGTKEYRGGAFSVGEEGIKRNIAQNLEDTDKDWARQLAIYGWLLGETVGSSFVTCIDQLVCCGEEVIGIAQHRTTVGEAFQLGLYARVREIWDRCKSGVFFSIERDKLLDGMVTMLPGLESLRER